LQYAPNKKVDLKVKKGSNELYIERMVSDRDEQTTIGLQFEYYLKEMYELCISKKLLSLNI